MEKQITSHIVKGAILGGISILFSIIIYVFNLYTTQWLSWLSYAILIGGIIYGNVLFANQNDNNVTFGNIFAHGFKTTAVIIVITVLYTILSSPSDNTVILPNGHVANNKVINFSKEDNRRVDLKVGIGYEEDIEKAKAVILEAIKNVPKVLEHPVPFVGVIGFGDSSVDLTIRPFARSVDYWEVYFASNEAIKKALDDNNIEIPYPHQVEISKKI